MTKMKEMSHKQQYWELTKIWEEERSPLRNHASSLMWTIIIPNRANQVWMTSVMIGERCMNVMENIIEEKIRGCHDTQKTLDINFMFTKLIYKRLISRLKQPLQDGWTQ